MKKVLLTTSALALMAGAASAGVSLSGSMRIHVQSIAGTTSLGNRTRVNFKATGQTDSGISYGFAQRIQANDGAAPGLQTPSLWVSNGMVKLTLGNADGAIGSTTGFYSVGGCGFATSGSYLQYCSNTFAIPFGGRATSTSPGNFTAYYSGSSSGGGATTSIVRADFSLGSVKLSVSGGNSAGGAANDTEVAASFAVGGWTLGVGHDTGSSSAANPSGNIVTAVGSLGATKIAVNYQKYSGRKGSWVLRGANGNISGYVASMSGTSTYGVQYNMPLGSGAVFNVAAQHTFNASTATAPVNILSTGLKFSF